MSEDYFKQDAKQLVDMMFEHKIITDGLTRDHLNGIEELISYTMQARFDSHWKAAKLFERITEHKNKLNETR